MSTVDDVNFYNTKNEIDYFLSLLQFYSKTVKVDIPESDDVP